MTPETPTPGPGAPVQVIGFPWSPEAHEVKDFLARNRVPYVWTDVEADPGALERVAGPGASRADLPLVVFPDGSRLCRPGDAEVAARIGLSTEAEQPFYDLVVVGGGPAGLAAAVYGASEGLRTVVVEREAPGGQAGQSARIENYLGFPHGLSGADLAARAVEQARGFGVEVVAVRAAVGLRADGQYRAVRLDDGRELYCHTVLLAMGVEWRTLDAPGCPELVGAGIYYGAASAEATAVRGRDVFLLGGGNSAGQAALHLARYARSVTVMAVEESLDESMSEYLLERISNTANIHVRPCCTVGSAEGAGKLERIRIRNVHTDEAETVPAEALFVFIGSSPRTRWLEGVVERDEQGFVRAAAECERDGARPRGWPLERDPLLLETSVPGVFVAGDVRAGSVKRVGAAVGEGSMAVQSIHAYLRNR